jgi:serine/threonine-protein kinase
MNNPSLLTTNLTATDKTINELLLEGYQGVNYELTDNEAFVATANHFVGKIQWLKTSPDEDGDIGLMTLDVQAFDELLEFMLDKFGWCPRVYSNKGKKEIHIFTPENELEEMAIELTTEGEYGWKGSLYRLTYVEKYQDKIGLIFATKPEDSEQQDWLLVQIDEKSNERSWSVHDGTLEQVYYIMAEEIDIPEPNYNPTPEQISKALNSQNSGEIPIHLLKEGKIDEWNKWNSEHLDEEIDLEGFDFNELSLTGANLSNVKGPNPISLCKSIDLDSLNDEEAEKLLKDVELYLLDNEFKGIDYYDLFDLQSLWLRVRRGIRDQDNSNPTVETKIYGNRNIETLRNYKYYTSDDYSEEYPHMKNVAPAIIPWAFVKIYKSATGDFAALNNFKIPFVSEVILNIIRDVFWGTYDEPEGDRRGFQEGLAIQVAYILTSFADSASPKSIPEIPHFSQTDLRS